jgi:hypothetical protein
MRKTREIVVRTHECEAEPAEAWWTKHHSGTGIRSMRIDDSTAVTCTNVEPWARDVVEGSLAKDDDRDLEEVARFLSGLPEPSFSRWPGMSCERSLNHALR